MRTLLINELEIDPAHLIKVLHYDGTPITARFIHAAIRDRLSKAIRLKKQVKNRKSLHDLYYKASLTSPNAAD